MRQIITQKYGNPAFYSNAFSLKALNKYQQFLYSKLPTGYNGNIGRKTIIY